MLSTGQVFREEAQGVLHQVQATNAQGNTGHSHHVLQAVLPKQVRHGLPSQRDPVSHPARMLCNS